MADSLIRQICKLCGRVRHLNGDGSWSLWYVDNRKPRHKATTAELVVCAACKKPVDNPNRAS